MFQSSQLGFKKPSNRSRSSASSKRKGCRCGNATATPGKLTCCGQRCPCYVESKPCTECKCKGCRNPHRPDGMKVILNCDNLQIILNIYYINPQILSCCLTSLIIVYNYINVFQVRPHIPQLDNIQLTLNTNPETSPSCSGSLDSLDTDTLTMEAMEESLNYSADFKSSNIKGNL